MHIDNLVVASEGAIIPHTNADKSLATQIHERLQEGIFDFLKNNNRNSSTEIAELAHKSAIERFQQDCEIIISKNTKVSSNAEMTPKLIAQHLTVQNFTPLLDKGVKLNKLALFNPL